MDQHEKPWHNRATQEVLDEVWSSSDGLSAIEAARRLATHGLNELPAAAGWPALLRFGAVQQRPDLLPARCGRCCLPAGTCRRCGRDRAPCPCPA
ncbi:cation-transporting P-type ATPase [Microvirga mediterraneensis]|uniref:cation-transporting P-type ATPase n=1 Tax=Microvirga mediterraneensis TaxID=2754695 RepID=UPI001FE9A999|nr:cation-transporting P-type ATPase [Microvirga mediterraneensis]